QKTKWSVRTWAGPSDRGSSVQLQDRFSVFQADRFGGGPHLIVSLDQKVIEIFDTNQAEPRKLHVSNSVEDDGQRGRQNDHVNPAARGSRSHAEASKQRPLPGAEQHNIERITEPARCRTPFARSHRDCRTSFAPPPWQYSVQDLFERCRRYD